MIPEKNSDKYVKQCELNLSRRVVCGGQLERFGVSLRGQFYPI